MSTLYIRDVDPRTAEVFKDRAAAAGMSLSVYVARQLDELASLPTNAEVAELLRRTPRTDGVTIEEILDSRDAARR